MDYNKIGEFIASERKTQKLTQVKLAEKLFVSEKTISKWENGNGIPDTNTLPKLCEIFGVTLNELLSGERSNLKDVQRQDKLLLDIAKELEQKNKLLWKSMIVIMIVSLVALFSGLFICSFLIPEGVWQILAVIAIAIIFLIPCFYALKLEVSIGAYKCNKCGTEIIPSYQEALNAMHMGTTRLLKCPRCKKRTWCKKVFKNKK